MENPELSSAGYWLSLIKRVEHLSALLVVLGVAGELLTSLIRGRFEQIVERDWQTKIAQANERAAEANLKAEQERLARVELEKAISPRSVGDELSFATKLKAFAGTRVIIEALSDVEVSRLAGQIAFILRLANWEIVSTAKASDDTLFSDGVTVEANMTPWYEDGHIMQDDTGPAANALVNELKVRELECTLVQERAVPRHTIRIRVGFKLRQYFSPKGLGRSAVPETGK